MDSPTDNYLSLLLSLPNVDPFTVLSLFFLTLARLLPIVAIAPFFGTKNVPSAIRIMFSLSLVAFFLPQNLLHIEGNLTLSYTFIWLFLKELLIGFALAYLSQIPFFLAQMAGSLIDHQRGASSLQVTDPTTQSQTGPIGLLLNKVTLVVFFYLGGPFLFLGGIANSYILIPVDQVFSASFFQPQTPFWIQSFGLLHTMVQMAAQIASPALIGILLTDLFLGIANRLAPQVQIVFLGIALKSWVGIALMTAAWGMMIQVIGKEAIQWFKLLNQLIEQMQFYR